jgi:hypothetical protein
LKPIEAACHRSSIQTRAPTRYQAGMTKRTPQIEAAIIAGFAAGRSLRSVCREHDLSRTAFLTWKLADPKLARLYEDVQLLHAEALLDDCLAIADDPLVNLNDGRGGLTSFEGESARYARFRLDSRLKVARIYFKRHEATVARRALEEEARKQAEAARDATREDEPTPETADQSVPRKPAGRAGHPDRRVANPAPLRAAACSATPVPTLRSAARCP